MSKIVLTGDVHVGLTLDDNMWSLRTIRDYMANNNIKNCCVLGDLFHDRFKTTHDASTQSYAFFKEIKAKYNQNWLTFPGNHDMALKNSWDVTSLRQFSDVMDVRHTVEFLTIDDQRYIIIPFVHLEDSYMKLVKAILKKAKDTDIILTHIGVKGATLNECFLLKNWSVVDFSNIVQKVYTGHFHCHQQIGENLWYPGSPIPFRYDEGVVDHGFLVYDTDTKTHEFIKIFDIGDQLTRPPDFITMMDDSITYTSEICDKNNIRIILNRDYAREELLQMREKLIEAGAKSVAWLRTRTEEISVDNDVSVGKVDLFQMWLDNDKPKHLDLEYVKEINEQVITQGNEKVIAATDFDED